MSRLPPEAQLSLSEQARSGLAKYIWKSAVPRECAIVLLANAPLAWLVFRGREDIGQWGWGGLVAYLGPMSFFLPFFTSFFGWMGGLMLKPYFGFTPVQLSVRSWLLPGSLCGMVHGVLGVIAMLAFLGGIDLLAPSMTWNAWQSVAIVSVVSCVFAILFHPVAIRRSLQSSR